MGLFKLIASGGNPITYAGLSAAQNLMDGKKKAPPQEYAGSWSSPGPNPLLMIGLGVMAVGVVTGVGAVVGAIGIVATCAIGAGVGAVAATGAVMHYNHNKPENVLKRDVARLEEQAAGYSEDDTSFMAEKVRARLAQQQDKLSTMTLGSHFNIVSTLPRSNENVNTNGNKLATTNVNSVEIIPKSNENVNTNSNNNTAANNLAFTNTSLKF